MSRTPRKHSIGVRPFHLNKILDLNTRGEWFHDKQGARTGIARTYGKTIGLNVMPVSWINFHPELNVP